MQKYKGKMWGLPSWGWSGHDCFITNKVQMEEMGFPVPDPMSWDTSMDTYADWIRKFHKLGSGPGSVDRFGLAMQIGDGALGPICRAFGGEFLSEDGTKSLLLSDENTQKGLKWAYDLIVTDKVVSTGGADLPAGHYASFAEGKVAMCMGGALDIVRSFSKAITDPKKAVPTAMFLPRRPDGKIPSWIFGGTWNINSQSKAKNVAYQFIRHITNRDGCLGFNIVAGEGALVRPDVFEVLKARHIAYTWCQPQLDEGMLFWPPAANVRGKEMRDIFVQYLTKLLDKTQPMPFEQGLEETHNAVQKVLDMEPA
jgi:ABC-type glycerol-3-phosphate transport system substrate-binding protein